MKVRVCQNCGVVSILDNEEYPTCQVCSCPKYDEYDLVLSKEAKVVFETAVEVEKELNSMKDKIDEFEKEASTLPVEYRHEVLGMIDRILRD